MSFGESPVRSVRRGGLSIEIPEIPNVGDAPLTTSLSPEFRLSDGTTFQSFVQSARFGAAPIYTSPHTHVYNIQGNYVLKAVRDAQLYENEVQCLIELRGTPYVTQIQAALPHNGWGYILMNMEHGATLAQFLGSVGAADKMPHILMNILHGLFEIHKRGIVHRDIKPANIWIPFNLLQPACLIDFGIARHVGEPNPHTGTIEYMREKSADRVTEDVDYYALGVILKAHPISVETAGVVAALQTEGITHRELSPHGENPGVVIKGRRGRKGSEGKKGRKGRKGIKARMSLDIQSKRSTRRLRRSRFATA